MPKNFSYWLISLLFMVTAITINRYFEIGMIGLTTFVLAYLTKGMRRTKGRRSHGVTGLKS